MYFSGRQSIINYYFSSLSTADFICGALVLPASASTAYLGFWPYDSTSCAIIGYISTSLWVVSVYTYMWIGVDRYLAIKKQSRYEVVQTSTRCQCWIIFSWITAFLGCCPPLLGFGEPYFDKKAKFCHLGWNNMPAYSITFGILVLFPTICTVIFCYVFVFGKMRKLKIVITKQGKGYESALGETLTNPNHVMSFIVIIAFWLAWIPYISTKLYENVSNESISAPLNFILFWFAISNSFWKFPIYFMMQPTFRHGMSLILRSVFCQRSAISEFLQGEEPFFETVPVPV